MSYHSNKDSTSTLVNTVLWFLCQLAEQHVLIFIRNLTFVLITFYSNALKFRAKMLMTKIWLNF